MDVVEKIKAELSSAPVVLFMKGTPDFPQCGFSAQTVQALRAVGAEFKHINIFEEPELREALKRYSNWPTYPQLYVNGEHQNESYVTHSEPDMDPTAVDFDWQKKYVVNTAEAAAVRTPSRNNWGPIVVPKDEYFVLGDNRDNSLDSRYWQFVPDSLIRGRPMFVYYSYDPDSLDRMSWLTRIRWTRIGERVR